MSMNNYLIYFQFNWSSLSNSRTDVAHGDLRSMPRVEVNSHWSVWIGWESETRCGWGSGPRFDWGSGPRFGWGLGPRFDWWAGPSSSGLLAQWSAGLADSTDWLKLRAMTAMIDPRADKRVVTNPRAHSVAGCRTVVGWLGYWLIEWLGQPKTDWVRRSLTQ
jgi:hypothetical protein